MKKYYCIKQHDKKDCGCACLATICKTYGLKYPISRIRETAGTDKKGTSAYGIIKAAQFLGFSAKAIRLNNENDIYKQFPLPAIAHIVVEGIYEHYVVVHKITDKKIIIADPEKGIVTYKIEEFLEIWTRILIIMVPTSDFKRGNLCKGFLTRYICLLKPQKRILLNVFISSMLITILGILSSFYFKILLDDIVPNNLIDTLSSISIGFILISIFKVVLEAIRSQMLIYLGQRLDIPLMMGYYGHVIKLPMNFFSSREVGEIISRLNDSSKIRDAISNVTLTVMLDLTMVVVGGGILYIQSKILFSITIIPLVLYAIIVVTFRNSIEQSNRSTMESNSRLMAYLVQSLNGIETVKSFNSENEVIVETEKRFVQFIKATFKLGTLNNIQLTLKNGVKGIFSIAILWVGTVQVLKGVISFGELLTYNALLVYFLQPVENLINLQGTIQTAKVASERLTEILDLSLEKSEEESKKIKLKSLKGKIKINDIDFRYGTRELILKKINLEIPNGQKVAFVGRSGSGKTTLAKLFLRFHECERGDILINDYNILDIDVEFLRDRIAYISQETFLFNGTITQNMRLGNPYVTYEEIIDACKKAQIHEYINSLPLRYNTLIEENGTNFSGGQRQRLSIARAILKKPDILIMDEATSNLDSITEKAIEKTINEFSKDATTIIIAHRLSTIMECDIIYILDKGEVVEAGDHNELLVKQGEYYKLWKEQQPDIDIILKHKENKLI